MAGRILELAQEEHIHVLGFDPDSEVEGELPGRRIQPPIQPKLDDSPTWSWYTGARTRFERF